MIQYLPAALQAGSSLFDYWNKSKRTGPRWYKDTATGQEQLRLSREGKYSPEAIQGIMSRQGSALGRGANRQRVNLRGYLQNRGMGDSIAGAGQLRAIDAGVGEKMGETARNLAIEDEMSKNAARMAYAQGSDAYGAMQRGQQGQRTTDLITGLSGAGTSAAGAYQQGQETDAFEQGMAEYQRAYEAGDLERARVLLDELLLSYGGQ